MNEVLMHMKYGSIVVLLAAGVGLFMLRPALVKQASAMSEIKEIKVRLADGDLDRARRTSETERQAQLQYSLAHDIKPIPQSSDIATLINSISGFIHDLDLRDQKLDRGKETVVGNTSSIGLDVETRGDFTKVVDLLTKIEALPRLVRISSLDLVDIDHSTGAVKATIGLEAFYKVGEAQSSETVPAPGSEVHKGM